jgi:hypothetical protein
MLVKLNILKGMKLNGVNTNPARIFSCTFPNCGNSAFMLSEKSTTNATQAAINSIEKMIETAIRDLCPKAMYAMSE